MGIWLSTCAVTVIAESGPMCIALDVKVEKRTVVTVIDTKKNTFERLIYRCIVIRGNSLTSYMQELSDSLFRESDILVLILNFWFCVSGLSIEPFTFKKKLTESTFLETSQSIVSFCVRKITCLCSKLAQRVARGAQHDWFRALESSSE